MLDFSGEDEVEGMCVRVGEECGEGLFLGGGVDRVDVGGEKGVGEESFGRGRGVRFVEVEHLRGASELGSLMGRWRVAVRCDAVGGDVRASRNVGLARRVPQSGVVALAHGLGKAHPAVAPRECNHADRCA